MQKVGHHLQVEAKKKAGTERDLFARSAYNRYYYAVFLAVRSMLVKLNANWDRPTHKGCPTLLKTTITKKFRTAKSRARKNSDSVLISKLESGIHAAAELANVMERAYAARIVADYEPSEAVNFTSAERFSLKSIEITEAHEWNGSVQTWTTSIWEAWRQIDV